jgi:hypothetical protein
MQCLHVGTAPHPYIFHGSTAFPPWPPLPSHSLFEAVERWMFLATSVGFCDGSKSCNLPSLPYFQVPVPDRSICYSEQDLWNLRRSHWMMVCDPRPVQQCLFLYHLTAFIYVCTYPQMLRTRILILELLLHSGVLDSSDRRSRELELDTLELAYKLAIGRLTRQVTSVNEKEWKALEQDMDSLKKKRRILQRILHDYFPDPQAVKARKLKYLFLSRIYLMPRRCCFSTALPLSWSNSVVHRSFERKCSPLSSVTLFLIIRLSLQYLLSMECIVVGGALWRPARPESKASQP